MIKVIGITGASFVIGIGIAEILRPYIGDAVTLFLRDALVNIGTVTMIIEIIIMLIKPPKE